MRKSRFSETQIVKILKEAEAGRSVSDMCRVSRITVTTFYKGKTQSGGMDASAVRRLKDLEAAHRRLKQMFAESSLANHIRSTEGKRIK